MRTVALAIALLLNISCGGSAGTKCDSIQLGSSFQGLGSATQGAGRTDFIFKASGGCERRSDGSALPATCGEAWILGPEYNGDLCKTQEPTAMNFCTVWLNAEGKVTAVGGVCRS